MSTGTFRAAVVRTPGGPDSIEIVDIPVTEPGPGEVRVEVAAASVNPVDVMTATGFFHDRGVIDQPDRTGLGWDFSGTIVATGPDVDLPHGTRVAGLVGGVDRDFGTHAEQLVVPVADVAVVPDDVDLDAAATVPLNALTAAQLLDQLGTPPVATARLLVTGAAGAVGAYTTALAAERGWQVTGWARVHDEEFVRGLGAEFTTAPEPGWDAVADAAALQQSAFALVRDGGAYLGVQPFTDPEAERGITTASVMVQPDGTRLAELLKRTASGELPARVHAELPLDRAAEAHRAVAEGGIRGRYVLRP